MARESSKWKRKELRKIPRKVVPVTTTNSSPTPSVDATVDPEQLNSEKSASALLLWLETNQDRTEVVDEIGQDREEVLISGGYVESWAAFADKYIQHILKLTKSNLTSLMVLGWFAFFGWLFVQENGSGKLDDFSGLQWFGLKIGILTVVMIIVSIAINKLWRNSEYD